MAADKKPGVLRNLRIKRVSLVDMGANYDVSTRDGAHIMLFKSAGPSLGSVHSDSPDWDADDMDEYEKSDLTADGRRGLPDSSFAAVWTDAQGKKHRKLPIHDAGHLAAARGRLSQAQIPSDVKAAARRKIEAASHKEKNVKKSIIQKILGLFTEQDVEKRTAAATALAKEIDGETSSDDPIEKAVHDADDPMCKCGDCMAKRVTGPVEKRLDEMEKAHKAEIAKANKRTEDAMAALEIEKAARLDNEMVTLLKAFKATPFNVDAADPKNDIAKFRKMKAESPELFERTMEILKAQDAQLATSKLFQNVGSSRTGTGDAWAQIEAKADAMVEKGAGAVTREQALEKVMLANPKLVAQYRSEQQ